MTRIFTSLLAVMAFGLALEAQTSFSLQEAIAYAQDHSTDVQLERLKVADAEGEIDEYYAIGIPKITGNVGYTHYFDIPQLVFPDFVSPAVYGVLFEEGLLEPREIETGPGSPAAFQLKNMVDVGLDLQTLILDGSYFVGLRAQNLYRELVAKRFKEVVYNQKETVSMAYLTVLNLDQNLGLLDQNISNLDKLYNDTKAIYESGFAEKLDADRLRLSLRNLKSERDNLSKLREVAVYALKFNMGYPMDMDIELTDDFDLLVQQAMVEDLSTLKKANYEDRPEYASIQTGIELQEMNIKRLKFGYLPTLNASAHYGVQLMRNDLFDSNELDWFKNSSVGVSLSVPIFDGLQGKANIQRAKISLDNARVQKSLFERSMELQVNKNFIEYVNAKDQVEQAKENLDLAQEIYDVTQIKFREGVGSSVEVIQAESELYNSQTNYHNALYSLITTSIQLKAAQGQL